MIKITDFIHCYENIVDVEICKAIIDNSENLDFTKSSTVGGDAEYRKCYINDLHSKFDKNIFESVSKVLKQYSSDHPNFSTGLSCEDTGYEHLIYVGSGNNEYKEHVDHTDLYPRVLTCSFILNDNYEGGDFVFFDGKYVVPPKTGSAVVFPSNFCFPHAVLPVTKGNRHAVITWIR